MKKILSALLIIMSCAGCAEADDSLYAIDHFLITSKDEQFREDFNQLTVDTYNWYKSIEGEDGVYILHSDHYTDDLLQEWKDHNLYTSIPEDGFWYFTVSVNYLEDNGFILTDEEKELISSGVRLYLLPDSLEQTKAETMQAFLREDSLYGLRDDPMIPTLYEKNRQIEFRTYHFEDGLDSVSEGLIKDPVILAAGCENMKYFESESLIATGRTDSYIKLTKQAYQKFGKNLPDALKEKKVTFKSLNTISN